VAGALHIIFEADLSRFVDYRPSVLYWMVQPGAEKEGVGLGVLRMIKPWTEWMLMWGYEVAAGPPEITDEFARELAVKLVGTDDFEMRVTSRLPWTVNHHFATTLARGRVFCVGDAVHRHPPTNGLGSNTSIQDSCNLAWKLHHVVAGLAGPSLLDSYDAERAPVARQIVERANQSIADTGRIVAALDVDDTTDVGKLNRQLALRKAPGPEGEKIRESLREAIAYKAYEFDAHGVEHNHRYASGAVVPDGTASPAFTRDPELYAQPTTWPGAKLPHTWVTRAGRRVSTLDLAGHGTFSVWTGIGGQAWLDAAARSAPRPACRSARSRSGRASRSRTGTARGPSSARSPTAASCWSARTCASRPGTPARPTRPSRPPAGSGRPSPRCSARPDERQAGGRRCSSAASRSSSWSTRCRRISSSACSASRRSAVRRSRGEASARSATIASGTRRCGPCGPSTSRDGICPERYQVRSAARDAPVSAAARSSVTQSEPSSWADSSSSSSQSSSRSSQSTVGLSTVGFSAARRAASPEFSATNTILLAWY
jgi:hypothetical protein